MKELQSKLSGQLITDAELLIHYSIDKSTAKACVPKAVIIAENENDIKETLIYANTHKIPVTVRAAGSGKSGGAIPEFEGFVISVEKLNKIIEIDKENACIVCEPGVITEDIKKAAQTVNLFYPLEPSSYTWCTIGGNIAENAGAAGAIKYGVTGNYVLGLQGFTGDAKPFSFGGKVHKDVAGFDMKRLLIGSEGCLAVITKIVVKLIPKPKYRQSLALSFKQLKDATHCLNTVARSQFWPSAAEFVDDKCIRAVEKSLNTSYGLPENTMLLILRLESDSEEGLTQQKSLLMDLSKRYNQAINHDLSESEIWQLRHAISDSLKEHYEYKVSEDITVPPAKIYEFLNFLKDCESQSPCTFLGFGHLGDGNIHVNLLANDISDDQWNSEQKKWIPEFFKKCRELGGTLSGEHGIGLTKKAYMSDYFSETELGLMKAIKASFDPNNILNPSKIF